MRTHSRSSASRLRAAGDRGYGTESRQRRRRLRRKREGEGAGPAHFRPAPSAWDPEAGPRSGGGAPGATPLLCLKGPMGSWRTGSLSKLSQWDVCLLVRRLQSVFKLLSCYSENQLPAALDWALRWIDACAPCLLRTIRKSGGLRSSH